ncbi:Hypothetical predicted protein [Cloeon dipterum]|uniref:Spaetzle domain-containing protein n=1 Tax=Cloeon dipterum TaxID=197152 RepID=A0A8S1BR43_9INSE|nr:Hypothetical predicted protein [Cloeon dipterum]
MSLVNFSLPFGAAPPAYAAAASEPFFNLQPPRPRGPPRRDQRPVPARERATPRRSQPQQPQQQGPYLPPKRSRQPQQPPAPKSSGSSAGRRAKPAPPRSPPQFTQVKASGGGSSSSGGGKPTHTIHAVIDYDDYDEVLTSDLPNNGNGVTPIEGPISLKNGSVPVVPLYSYPLLRNGSFVQIPIMWTALSLALGLEIRGEIIRGVPCIKRYHQLFCPSAGNSYPIDRIERFIDENKALMKRMYGEFLTTPDFGPPSQSGPGQEVFKSKGRTKRQSQGNSGAGGLPPPSPGDSYFAAQARQSRQSSASSSASSGPNGPGPFRTNQSSESGRLDSCESKVEIVTPYWASNSAGKIRAIVNTQHFEQAIHQEVCSKVQTKRCSGDCGCEQKYKWHRLLAYDPDNDCKGIFMDWFLFPSCCVCRCAPLDGK